MSEKKPIGRPRVDPAKRFWAKVIKAGADDCWEWSAAKNKAGYGWFSSGGRGGKQIYAHRVSYAFEHGMQEADLTGLVVRHKCDNPPCVNPAHLELGTQAENIADALSRGHLYRQIKNDHCWRGHRMTPENTYRTSDGRRACRTCRRERLRLWREIKQQEVSA